MMHRVGSTAMQSLAAYSDSDEEEFVGGGSQKRRSSEVLTADVRNRRTSTSDTLPEAPASRDSTPQRATSSNSTHSSIMEPQISPEPGNSPKDASVLKEPPPPARPMFYTSPSPASSASETPMMKEERKLATNPSSMSLVSYGNEDDDELDKSHDVEQHEDGDGDQIKIEDEEHMDVHALLEQTLEGGSVGTPASTGSESPSTLSDPHVDATLPPPPEKRCSQELIDRFAKYFQQKANGVDFNKMIQSRTDFRNPSIYEKLIEHFGIDEIGSNFPKSVFDPHGFKPSDYYDKIAEAQKVAMDKLEKEKHAKGEAAKKEALTAIADRKSRKSKWDVPVPGSKSETKKVKTN